MATVVQDIADKIAAKDLASQDFITAENSATTLSIFPVIKAGYRSELLQLCDALGVAYHKEELDSAWMQGHKSKRVKSQSLCPGTKLAHKECIVLCMG